MNLLKIGEKTYDLDKKTLIMGILNITPDSFFDGGRYFNIDEAVNHAKFMEKNGANIIDIGGESTRPYSKRISIKEEINRVIPIIDELSNKISIPVSLDTYKFEVAKKGIESGIAMINDITALRGDKKLTSLITEMEIPICLMHMKGKPSYMQKNPIYFDIISEISQFFEKRINYAVSSGIEKDKIIIDPGIGFGKRTGKGIEDNCVILKNLNKFEKLGCPILIGVSRKRFIGNICGREKPLSENERLEGSLAATCVAVLNGANIIRAHDVKETRKCVDFIDCIKYS
jgi:dihydropteroate synthase